MTTINKNNDYKKVANVKLKQARKEAEEGPERQEKEGRWWWSSDRMREVGMQHDDKW